METHLNSTAFALCVGCVHSGRKLILIEDEESKQMYTGLLGSCNVERCSIHLCFECLGRLKSALSFKNQIKEAHHFLTRVSEQIKPRPLSKLSIKATETHEWKPNRLLDQMPPNSHKDEYFENSPFTYSDDETEFDNLDKSKIHKLDSHQENIKKENEEQKSAEIDIKLEPTEEVKETKVSIVPVTKYEFNESDDEPLTVTKAFKKTKTKGANVKYDRPAGVVTNAWVQRKLDQLNVQPGQLEMVVLSWEEIEQERQKCLTSVAYTRHEFRCTDCIIGFNHRVKLEAHMKKHLPESGNFECHICKTRTKNQGALLCHIRRHRSRWRCCACGAMYSRAAVAADHVSRSHAAPPPTHSCRLCDHQATSLGKLRVHMKSHAERQHCEQCGKTFRDKSSLKTHLYIHTNQMDYACDVCDKKFRFKKALEIHSFTHRASELLYCADCDMNFKNRLSLYQHLKYSLKHIDPDKIKYACEFCSRRFSKMSRLEEHRLSIHLKLAPHKCTVEGCTFASAARSCLRTHNRMVHRNKRFERNYVCHTCGKTFTTKKVLECHIRSHTGERPLQCARCPATFAHDAALYNHNKLVHKIPPVRRQKETAKVGLSWPAEVIDPTPSLSTSVPEA